MKLDTLPVTMNSPTNTESRTRGSQIASRLPSSTALTSQATNCTCAAGVRAIASWMPTEAASHPGVQTAACLTL